MSKFDGDPFGPEALTSLSTREQRTVIGHASIDLMSPLSAQTLDEVTAQIPPGARMLDIGCGKAALARHVLRRDRSASAVCIELNPVLAAQGEALARKEGTRDRLRMIVADGREWRAAERFDAIALLGATHAIGSLQEVLAYAMGNMKTGGVVLLGEGIWASRPDPEYLAFLGADEDELTTPEAFIGEVRKAGFRILYEHRSNAEEWDAYEGPYFRNLRSYVDASGEHSFAAEADAFEAMQARYGRACMGFVVLAASWEGV